MRIIITSGKGAGQYAYITGFNAVTRDTTVAKESNPGRRMGSIIPELI